MHATIATTTPAQYDARTNVADPARRPATKHAEDRAAAAAATIHCGNLILTLRAEWAAAIKAATARAGPTTGVASRLQTPIGAIATACDFFV